MTEDVLAPARADGVHVFGAGSFARDLARALGRAGVPVRAFVTTRAPAQEELDGVAMRPLDEVDLRARPLWIGVFNRESHSDYGMLDRRLAPQAGSVVWPQQAYTALEDALGFRFWLAPRSAYDAAADAIANGRALLEDDASRVAFDRVLAFRREAHAAPPAPGAGPQYLPPWLQDVARARGPLGIVDGGAYRGETLRALAAHAEVAAAWAFEPDAENFAALVRAMRGCPRPLTCIPAGLGAATGSATFSANAGEASRFDAGGAHSAPIVALDDCLQGARVGLLKLDVEGHELAALSGARATLLRERPLLAIAAYHRWDDLWRLPAFIHGLGAGYRLRLGLHAHNSFDSVIYAH